MSKAKYLKIIVVVAVCIIVALTFSFAGCKKEAAKTTEATTAAETTAVATTAAETTVATTEEVAGTVKIWSWEPWPTDFVKPDYPIYQKYPNIKLDFTSIEYPDNNTKFLVAAAAGEGLPDIILQTNQLLSLYASMGTLLDLTDRVSPHRSELPEWAWEQESYNGKVYGIPTDAGPVVLFYRTDIFKEAGIDINSIETWNDLFEAGKKIYAATNGKTKLFTTTKAGILDFADSAIGLIILQEIGSGIYDKDGNIIINTPKNIEIIKFLKEVVDSGICLEEGYWTPGNYSAMEDGTVATVINGGWMGGYLKTVAPKSSGKWGVTYMPAWEKGGNRSSNNGGSFLAITSQSTNPDLAWKVAEFILLSKEGLLYNSKHYDIFSLFKPIWDDPSLLEPDPFYNNTIMRKIYSEVAGTIRPLNYGKNWIEASNIIVQVSSDYFNGKISAEDCLKNIEEKLKGI